MDYWSGRGVSNPSGKSHNLDDVAGQPYGWLYGYKTFVMLFGTRFYDLPNLRISPSKLPKELHRKFTLHSPDVTVGNGDHMFLRFDTPNQRMLRHIDSVTISEMEQ